eukprot:1185940-Prorocentrum_minimum.AAC.7
MGGGDTRGGGGGKKAAAVAEAAEAAEALRRQLAAREEELSQRTRQLKEAEGRLAAAVQDAAVAKVTESDRMRPARPSVRLNTLAKQQAPTTAASPPLGVLTAAPV